MGHPAIDLRSDTVTKPTAPMRAAMAAAPVGDDQFGEDPTTNQLQEKVAYLFGKEAALWAPSGTMVNQIAFRTLTRPGDDVVACVECHAKWHEAGAAAANSGVQFTEIGSHGAFTVDEFLAACKPRGHSVYPATTLVEIENTHNRSGGTIFPQEQIVEICAAARERQVASFLDGARIWNVSIATGTPLAELAAPFDLVGGCFSKGLGAPGGSILAGSKEVIARARRHRRMLGGAMRQVGIFAAAGLFVLDHHLERLAEDHANAKGLAGRLAACPRVRLNPGAPQTNIVVFHLGEGAPDAATVVASAKECGVLVLAFGARTIRAVTHLDVTAAQCEEAAEILLEIIARE